HYFIKE
ncbi:hypothetical protein D046_0448, partial [Vibrio parahaemolyticus V-223/04]